MSQILAICLLTRALMPLGYMPGNLLAGELMTLCPVASAGAIALLQPEDVHLHHHQDHGDVSTSLDQTCPIGTALQLDTVPQAVAPATLAPHRNVPVEELEYVSHIANVYRYRHPRGPPLA